jgi:signal transduction histidine kinase
VADALRAHDPAGIESVVSLEPARTAGDPALLERLAANLVSNAIRHNVYGGRIELATYTRSERAILVVANTGPLVPNGDLERLFQPFERFSSTPRSSGDGVGLGLAIVEAIATAHEARLAARARPGGGLEIRVSFCALRGVPAGDAL